MDLSMDSIDSSASKEQNLGATTVGQQNEAGPNTFSAKGDAWIDDAGTSSATLAAATSPHSAGKRAPSMARVAMIGRAHAQMQEQLQRPGEVGVAGVETEGGQRLAQMWTNLYADGDACNHTSEGGSFRSNFSGRGNGEGSHKRLVSNYVEWSGDDEECADNIHWEESPEMSHGSIHRFRYNSIVGASMLDDESMSGGHMTPPLGSSESGSPPTRSGSPPLSLGFHVGSAGSNSSSLASHATLKALASAAEAERQRRRSVSILMRRASSGVWSEQAARDEARDGGDARRVSVLQTRLAEQDFRRRGSAGDQQGRCSEFDGGRRDGGDNEQELVGRSHSHDGAVHVGEEGVEVLSEDAPIISLTRRPSGARASGPSGAG